MFTFFQFPALIEDSHWLFALLATALAAALWIWHLRYHFDFKQKIHCADCDYRGHPRLKNIVFRGIVHVCPRCGSEKLIPVLPRHQIHEFDSGRDADATDEQGFSCRIVRMWAPPE